jgi:hypothetical protein
LTDEQLAEQAIRNEMQNILKAQAIANLQASNVLDSDGKITAQGKSSLVMAANINGQKS